MKVNDILNLSADKVMSLSARELRSLTKTLVDASNKRIKRLEESQTARFSGAYRSLRGGKMHHGKVRSFTTDFGKLKAKVMRYKKNVYRLDKDTGKWLKSHSRGEIIRDKSGKPLTTYRNKLLKEFSRASRFLNDKTSSVSGTRDVVKDVESRLGGKFKSKAQANRFWDAYNAIKSDYGDVMKGRNISTDEIQAMIYGRIYKGGKERKDEIDDIIDNMRDELEKKYVKGEKAEAEEKGEPDTPFSIRFEKVKIF